MSAHQFPISDVNPILVGSGFQGDLTLYNESTTTTIYVGDLPNLNGFPLGPGMTLTWDAGKPLYAYMGALNQVAMLDVVENGGAITSPGQIASQILQQGLASAIANSISITGAPPLDVNEQIFNRVFNAEPDFSGDINVSKYQSIIVGVYETAPASGVTPHPRQIDIQFIDTDTVVMRGTYDFSFSDTNATFFGGLAVFASARVPVLAKTLRVLVSANGFDTRPVGVYVIGSYKAVNEPAFSFRSGYWQSQIAGDSLVGQAVGLDGLMSWNVPVKAASTDVLNYPSHIAGDGVFTVDADTVTASGSIRLVDAANPFVVYASVDVPIAATYQRQIIGVMLPNRPLAMLLTGPLAGTNITTTLTYRVR